VVFFFRFAVWEKIFFFCTTPKALVRVKHHRRRVCVCKPKQKKARLLAKFDATRWMEECKKKLGRRPELYRVFCVRGERITKCVYPAHISELPRATASHSQTRTARVANPSVERHRDCVRGHA
jgi:hypothetical protein